ncbi:MAG: D-alanyl-D-alanine carboxypeptidase family protein, partial [Candidatus Planktophila sp.]
MFFVAVLLMAFSTLLGGITSSVNAHFFNKSEIKFNSVYCFNKPTQKLIIRPEIIGCVVGEDEALGESEINKGTVRPNKLNPNVLARFHSAQAAAKLEGIDLKIDSGYRTIATQNYLFQRAIKDHETPQEAIKWVLPGDLSRHPWGLALDVNLHHAKSGASWLEANGATFGLCRVYENEWWHFEPLIAPGGICPP